MPCKPPKQFTKRLSKISSRSRFPVSAVQRQRDARRKRDHKERAHKPTAQPHTKPGNIRAKRGQVQTSHGQAKALVCQAQKCAMYGGAR